MRSNDPHWLVYFALGVLTASIFIGIMMFYTVILRTNVDRSLFIDPSAIEAR